MIRVFRTTSLSYFFFFNDTATTEIYTLSLHDALPICEAATRVVEDVDRPHREPHVALRIDVIQRHPPRLLGIPHVDVLVQHDDHLSERHEPLPPQPVHHLVGLPGILFVDAHEDEVVKDPLGRHVQVHEL